MKIKTIVSQHRRDFHAIYKCEHCGHESKSSGYDDRNFHENVIPNMVCSGCNLKAGEDYKPLAPKYSDHQQV